MKRKYIYKGMKYKQYNGNARDKRIYHIKIYETKSFVFLLMVIYG